MKSRLTLVAAFAALAWGSMAALAAAAENALPETVVEPAVEPLVLMKAGDIEACGLALTFIAGGETIATQFLLRKDDKAELGTQFVLSALWPKPDAGGFRTVTALSLTAGGASTGTAFGAPVARSNGVFEATGTLPATSSDLMMRDLMIGGAVIDLHDQSGERRALAISGPMSQSIRAIYLNCAGDMFRPDPAR